MKYLFEAPEDTAHDNFRPLSLSPFLFNLSCPYTLSNFLFHLCVKCALQGKILCNVILFIYCLGSLIQLVLIGYLLRWLLCNLFHLRSYPIRLHDCRTLSLL